MTALSALLCSAPGDPGPRAGKVTEDLFGISDAAVLDALRASSASAERMFERVYRVFHPRLVAIASGYVERAVAEELAQDVLFHVWDHRASWVPAHGIAVYLYAAARNRALKQLKHQGIAWRTAHTTISVADTIPGLGQASDTAHDRIERDDLLAYVDRALARLPELSRTAFTLRWIHQLAYAEVAVIMDIAEPAARKHVSRAREALLSVLRDVAG
jgi:RNA polymerase sigma factor (sigma-70 family)